MSSQRRDLIITFGIVAVVLFGCRGLILGSGTYGIYIDNAWPPDARLLHGIAEDRTHLWNGANLGTRVLYPSEYPVDEGILGALRLGVPAWVISRLVPIALLALAGIGMSVFLRALRREMHHGETPSTAVAITSGILGVGYALSPLAFTEVVAGHYLYLIALALAPLAARAWLAVERPWSLGLCAVLIALVISQIQFAVMLPLLFAGLALSLRSFRLARRGAAAYALGLVPHLAWIVPLAVYRPANLSLDQYIDPATAHRFAISPLNSIRALGYITPFAERTITLGRPLWELLTFILAAAAIIAVIWSGSARRLWPLYVLAFITVYYQWGARAPFYRGWRFVDSTPIGALFRERYHLTFLVFTSLLVICFVFATDLVRRRTLVEGIGLTILAVAGLTWQFGDGHLGRYGAVRDSFSVDGRLGAFFASHPQTPVVSIPAGSIVKRRNWLEFGRSPFHLGGPRWILDPEGSQASVSMPYVRRLSDALNGPNSAVSVRRYLQLLHVGYVVLRPDLYGDLPSDVAVARQNLVGAGYRLVYTAGRASVWQSRGPDQLRFDVSGRLLAGVGDAAGSILSSRLWNALLVAPETESTFTKLAASRPMGRLRLLRLDHRPVTFARGGRNLRVTEPVLLREGEHWASRELRYNVRLPAGRSLFLADGRAVPAGRTTIVLDGPVNRIYIGTTRPRRLELADPSFEKGFPPLQDVQRTDDRTAREAGLKARLVPRADGTHALAVQARAHAAGIPIRLPLIGTDYDVAVDARYLSGAGAQVAAVADGRDHLVTKTIPRTRRWTTVHLHFDVPPGTADLELYLYVFAGPGGRVSAAQFDNVRGVASRRSARQIPLIPGQIGPLSGQLSDVLRPRSLRLRDASFERHLPVLQDVQKTDKRTPRQAGLAERLVTNGSDGAHALYVQAKAHAAGVPIPLPLNPASDYEVSVDARFISGRAAAVSVVANGRDHLATVTVPRRKVWDTLTLRCHVPADTGDLYLYLYVYGPGDGSTSATLFDNVRGRVRSNPRAYVASTGHVRDIHASVQSISFRMPRGHGRDATVWLTDGRGSDPAWSLKVDKGSVKRLPWPINGYANAWALSAPRGATVHATALYLPNRLFQRLIIPLWAAIFALAALPALAQRRRHLRKTRERPSPAELEAIASDGAFGSSLRRRESPEPEVRETTDAAHARGTKRRDP